MNIAAKKCTGELKKVAQKYVSADKFCKYSFLFSHNDLPTRLKWHFQTRTDFWKNQMIVSSLAVSVTRRLKVQYIEYFYRSLHTAVHSEWCPCSEVLQTYFILFSVTDGSRAQCITSKSSFHLHSCSSAVCRMTKYAFSCSAPL